MGFCQVFYKFQQPEGRPQGVCPAESQRVILGTPERGTRGAGTPLFRDLSEERVEPDLEVRARHRYYPGTCL